jgi:micrococcal nuclease
MAFVTSVLLLLPSAHAATPRTLVAKVERVSDGDTITALTSEGTKLRIRLLGIDAPEIPHGQKPGQPYGIEAHDYLARLIGGRTIQVQTYGPDKYKRILAIAFLGAVNVNVPGTGGRGRAPRGENGTEDGPPPSEPGDPGGAADR